MLTINKNILSYQLQQIISNKDPISIYQVKELNKMLTILCKYYIADLLINKLNYQQNMTVDNLIVNQNINLDYKRCCEFLIKYYQSSLDATPVGSEILNKLKLTITEINNNFPKFQNIFKLLDHCMSFYPKVLCNICSGLNALFPNGDLYFVDKHFAEASLFNKNIAIFAELLAAWLSQHNTANISLLEVGSGIGAVARLLLDNLKYPLKKYLFSDVSPAFIINAKNNRDFGYEFMDFSVIDICKPVPENLQNKFDVLLACNVIHATTDIKITLRNIQKFLKKDGYLVLIELCYPHLYQHLIWGLTKGWWCHKDNYRTTLPTLSLLQWQEMLNQTGYTVEFTFPGENDMMNHEMAILFARTTA